MRTSLARSSSSVSLPFDNCMKRRLIPVLPPESLLSMATKQLLGRLHSLQRCEEAAAFSHLSREEITASEGILFKDSAEWQRAYADLKAVLATREHIPTAAERATARQDRAKRKSNKTVQRTGASRLAHKPNRTSSAAGSCR